MNTSINFNPVNTIQAGSKIAHVFRDHNLNKKRVSQEIEKNDDSRGAIILHPYVKLIDTRKQGTSKITKNLAVYRKRYEVALAKGDTKTAERNKKKIEQLEVELQGFRKARRGREASLVEASWSITKFPPSDALAYDKDILLKMKDIALKILQDNFPELDIDQVGVAGHIDQASIHIHTVFDIPESTTFSKMLKDKKYGEFQREFNDAIRKKFSGLPIEKITPHSKKYLPLLEYKKLQLNNLQNKPKELSSIQKVEVQVLSKTDPSKEEFLSLNKLLEINNEDLRVQLALLKELNKEKEAENIKLQAELKYSREKLQLAQRLNKPREEKYIKPLDAKEIKKQLQGAESGSLESSRLGLVLTERIDFSSFTVTPENKEILDRAKKDYDALTKGGLLKEDDGVYSFSNDQAKSIVYHFRNAEVKEIIEEYTSIQGNIKIEDVFKRKEDGRKNKDRK